MLKNKSVMFNISTFLLKVLLVPFLVYVWENVYDTYSASTPLVLTNNGWVRGLRSPDGDYDMFLGIPYGKVRRDNPFGVADPYPKYDGVFEATDNTKNCPQYDEISNTYGGTLDCLNVNVYVPRPRRGKLSVMVYIYGGRFLFGFSGNFHNTTIYGPQHLMRHNVMLVIFNHRVGPYGFMCLGTKEVPGNTGLKDQTRALRWVKDNIGFFGGDANKITLFGHSSGALSLDHHIHYQPEDLFHQAILQSGTIMMPNSVGNGNTSVPLIIANKLGFSTDDLDEAVKYLAKINPIDVVKASVSTIDDYRPCLEKEFQGVENFITAYPIYLVPKVKNKRFLMGHTREENNMEYANISKDFFDKNDIFKLYVSLLLNASETEVAKCLSEVKKFYIGNNEVSGQFKEHIVNFTSDLLFNYAIHRQMDRFLKNKADKIYYYMFTYSGGRNLHKVINNLTVGGAMHADEVGYLYQPSFFREETSKDDQLIVDRMTTLWTNFAKYGDPTPVRTDLLPVKWSSISEDSRPYFRIDSKAEMGTEMYTRMNFWNRFYEKYGKNIRY